MPHIYLYFDIIFFLHDRGSNTYVIFSVIEQVRKMVYNNIFTTIEQHILLKKLIV